MQRLTDLIWFITGFTRRVCADSAFTAGIMSATRTSGPGIVASGAAKIGSAADRLEAAMLYRILIRLAKVLLAIPLVLLALAILITPGPIHLHTDAVGLVIAFGPAAMVAGLAWIVKSAPTQGLEADSRHD